MRLTEDHLNNKTIALISGRVDRACATEAVDSGSIPGRVRPKTIKKLVFTASLFYVSFSN